MTGERRNTDGAHWFDRLVDGRLITKLEKRRTGGPGNWAGIDSEEAEIHRLCCGPRLRRMVGEMRGLEVKGQSTPRRRSYVGECEEVPRPGGVSCEVAGEWLLALIKCSLRRFWRVGGGSWDRVYRLGYCYGLDGGGSF